MVDTHPSLPEDKHQNIRAQPGLKSLPNQSVKINNEEYIVSIKNNSKA